MFKHQPILRSPILEDLGTTVLPYLYPVGGKAPSRLYLAQGSGALSGAAGGGASGGSLPIQMCVALVMQVHMHIRVGEEMLQVRGRECDPCLCMIHVSV